MYNILYNMIKKYIRYYLYMLLLHAVLLLYQFMFFLSVNCSPGLEMLSIAFFLKFNNWRIGPRICSESWPRKLHRRGQNCGFSMSFKVASN